MTINPGMLIFCLLDSAIAFLLVFFVSRAKFGGEKSMLARVISAILGTLVFIVHFGVLIWFNTEPVTISAAGKAVVYAAPIVLSILMIILTLLSQPPKKKMKRKQKNPRTTRKKPQRQKQMKERQPNNQLCRSFFVVLQQFQKFSTYISSNVFS